MLQIQVSSVLDRAAFFLNDVNRAYFTNSVLIDPFVAAYDDLREALMDNNVALLDSTSEEYTIALGVTNIGGPGGPPLPTDFIAPYAVWERLAGSTNDYDILEKRQFLPKTSVLTNALTYWAYSKQIIKFIGANTPRNVKIDYIANNLSIAEDPEEMINVFIAKSFLSYRTAALAAEYLGENPDRATTLNGNASRSIETIINTDVKNRQNIQTIRRPFRGRRWGVNTIG